MVFISKEKLYVSAYSGHLQVLTILGILYKTLLAENCQPEDGRYRPKHVVFSLLINTIT